MCGGYSGLAMDLFDTTSSGATVNKTGFSNDYVGCFVDQPTRSLTGLQYVNVGMTNAMCNKVCLASGYKVAGTESGNACYCGSALPVMGLSPVSYCSTSCSGEFLQRDLSLLLLMNLFFRCYVGEMRR
jgi:hypothetical protein